MATTVLEGTNDGLAQVAALLRDGLDALRPGNLSLRSAVLWQLWLTAIVGDAGSTLLAVHDGRLQEGNPGAAFAMSFLGVTGYVLVASVFCLFMAVISTGRPTGWVARVAVAGLLCVPVVKIVLAYHNLLLWQAS